MNRFTSGMIIHCQFIYLSVFYEHVMRRDDTHVTKRVMGINVDMDVEEEEGQRKDGWTV